MNPTIERLAEAMNRHDPAGMAAVMAPDYRSEQPVHPNRGFGGTQQVIENWTAVFGAVPDLVIEIVGTYEDGAAVASEWSWHGTHTDGTPWAMRGVIVFGLREDGLIQWARLYMEPLEPDGAAIAEAVQHLVQERG